MARASCSAMADSRVKLPHAPTRCLHLALLAQVGIAGTGFCYFAVTALTDQM
jgi:hypothetical protein